jgi:hypothetical protein
MARFGSSGALFEFFKTAFALKKSQNQPKVRKVETFFFV